MHMRWKPALFSFSVLFALGGSLAVHAQNKPTPAQIEKADFYFRNNNFAQALPLYQQLDGAQPNDPVTNYRIGVCLLHTPEQETRAIPPLEVATRSKDPKVPAKVHQHLGEAYHLAYRFEEAIASFTRYQSLTAKSDPRSTELERQLQTSRVAQRLMRDTVQVYIQNLGAPINSPATEYGPVISADESVLMYTTLKSSIDKATAVRTETEDILIAQKEADAWGAPRSIGLNTKSNIGSVGLSPDGQRLLLYVGGRNANNGDLFISQLTGRQWGAPVKLNGKVNSSYQENSGSVTPDEKTLYFSSNRPGGLGGYDVYRATKNDRGEWDHVVNLGAPVNSRYDEDAPFIHPDRKTLYFSANGRNSMGGNDVFRSVYENGTWSVPSNLGYPINTVHNDYFFVLSADGKKGYFSSNRPGGQGGQDLYFLGIPEEQGIVPLTMMKGRVIAGDRPVPTRIRVIDRQSKEVIKNVYHPNRETGQYLIIFPPGRNYDMVIEAEGFLPQVVNIHVPNQNYFYELYQEIYLKAIMKAGKVVGQEIVVKNIFEDVEKNQAQFDPAKFGKNNLDLYELMDNIIASSDSVALDYLLTLMYAKTSPSLQEAPSEPMRGTYYYEDNKGKLLPLTVDGQTVYALPTLSQVKAQAGELAEDDAKPAPDKGKVDITAQTEIKPNLTYVFHFDSDKVELGREAIPELEKLYEYLRKYPAYGIRVSGFADADGTSERNHRISEQRARQVAQYMTGKGIGAQRVVAKGYGQAPEAAKATTEAEKRRFRITEITVLEVTKLK
ncbi:MAG: PD40 domain-containing protein [Ferruginibacter sp.]|nr:PD40 domain-containing protein [Cytophagales bacterium]